MVSSKPKRNYRLGDICAIELDNGVLCAGFITRGKRGSIVLIHAFPRIEEVSERIATGVELRPEDVVYVGLCVDNYIRCGRWPITAHSDGWQQAQWDAPPFFNPGLIGSACLVTYDRDNLARMIGVEKCEVEMREIYPRDALHGTRSFECTLTELLFGRDAIDPNRSPTTAECQAEVEEYFEKQRARARERRAKNKK